jgi:demethylmenaquinone methyltransferase/2-methoxy-6-polyprenyl-1,4-benzoquinol methylase
MDKNQIITFFDDRASAWDSCQERNEEIIAFILDKGEITKGKKILDVACGTGILFTDYLNRGAAVTGVDISSGMLRIAKNKFPDIQLICEDAEEYEFEKDYDAVMIYNAFPHFSNPEKLIGNLGKALKVGGRFTVAHGMSEKELEKCHSTVAKDVSLVLPSKEKLCDMMSEIFDVDVMISDEEKYIVSGLKK